MYWEGEIDDFAANRVPRVFWEDGAQMVGLHLDRLRGDGALALDAELRHTPLRLFEHGQFTSGVTYQRQVLGDPLGPNAGGGYASLTWRPAPLDRVTLGTALERRDPTLYRAIDPGAAGVFHFERVKSLPVERRARLELSGARVVPLGVGGSLRVGVDRVTNENLVSRAARWRPFAEALVQLHR